MLANPLEITWGEFSVGGASQSYLLREPYKIDLAHPSLALTFSVQVVAESLDALYQLCDSLEEEFRKRDQDLTISINGQAQEYAFGDSILNTQATCSKSGDETLDRGRSRAYLVTITGELPSTDTAGLRDLEVTVDYEASRQRIVTMRGVYTPDTDAEGAVAAYEALFDNEAQTILDGFAGGATFELVDESYSRDRNDHTCRFNRQYVELLYNQTTTLDDQQIRDHRVVFTRVSSHPGDSVEGMNRLQRVLASYSCAVDIDQSTDPYDVFKSSIKQHLDTQFAAEFSPTQYCVENLNVALDRTGNRLSAQVTYLYQPSEGAQPIVEASQSLAYRESRVPGLTPVHSGGEYDYYVDPAWATLEQVWTRVVKVLGDESPKLRIAAGPQLGPAGPLAAAGQTLDPAPPGVPDSGWVMTQNTSQVEDIWIGDPETDQIKLSVLTETAVRQYFNKPQIGTASSQPRTIITPTRG